MLLILEEFYDLITSSLWGKPRDPKERWEKGEDAVAISMCSPRNPALLNSLQAYKHWQLSDTNMAPGV